MKNKLFLSGITGKAALTAVLALALVFAGCQSTVVPTTTTPAISISADATLTEITAAVTAAVAGQTPAAGKPWVVPVSLDLSGAAFNKLYAAIAAAIPTGTISLDLSASTGTSIAPVDLPGTDEEQQAIRDRFVSITLPDSVTVINGDEAN